MTIRLTPTELAQYQQRNNTHDLQCLQLPGGAIRLTYAQPLTPISLNALHRLHHMQRARHTKTWRTTTATYTRIATTRNPAAWWAIVGNHSTIHVTLTFPEQRRRDPHNYVGSVIKACVDGLVDAQLWPDDTPDNVTVAEPALRISTDNLVHITITPTGGAE